MIVIKFIPSLHKYVSPASEIRLAEDIEDNLRQSFPEFFEFDLIQADNGDEIEVLPVIIDITVVQDI